MLLRRVRLDDHLRVRLGIFLRLYYLLVEALTLRVASILLQLGVVAELSLKVLTVGSHTGCGGDETRDLLSAVSLLRCSFFTRKLLLLLAPEPALLLTTSLLSLNLGHDLVYSLVLCIRWEALDVTAARLLNHTLIFLARRCC